ncbi:hypothetical protein K456DRAFT_308582 [Colletotrichum gloeosporioides 23]|nr:hypothetical protein K456DRAFT_308582 [Colletotrichum gloeosporioides 23]
MLRPRADGLTSVICCLHPQSTCVRIHRIEISFSDGKNHFRRIFWQASSFPILLRRLTRPLRNTHYLPPTNTRLDLMKPVRFATQDRLHPRPTRDFRAAHRRPGGLFSRIIIISPTNHVFLPPGPLISMHRPLNLDFHPETENLREITHISLVMR